jgi:hypothetical protein
MEQEEPILAVQLVQTIDSADGCLEDQVVR